MSTIARLEGLPLVLMMLVATPLRHATGLSLDGGTAALGRAHGGLVLIYLQALQATARLLGWSWPTVGGPVLASLAPFGTLVFERWYRDRAVRRR